VTAGVDVEREEGASDGALVVPGGPTTEIPTRFRLERTVYAPFAELQLVSSRGWTLYGGARVDVPDDFASRVSPRAGGQYRVESTRTTVRVNWGEGFKLPSFFALANPIVGNPRLGPETSESLEVGVLQTVARGVEVGVTAFRSRFFDLVDLAEGPPPRLVNRSEVTARGVELTGDLVRFARLGLSAHLTYTETDIKGTDERLRNRPKWRGGVRARYQPRSDLVVGLGILYVGAVLDSSIPTGDRELGDYVRVDLTATWTPRPRWQLWLGVENALGARYEEAVGFPAPGIAVRVGVRVTL
jgi:vitamin B12 transporter